MVIELAAEVHLLEDGLIQRVVEGTVVTVAAGFVFKVCSADFSEVSPFCEHLWADWSKRSVSIMYGLVEMGSQRG